MLEAGADPNLRGSMTPPLTSAASQGHLEIATRLLELGAENDGNCKIFAQMNEHASTLAKIEEVEVAREAVPRARVFAPGSAF